jgi:hypothetical protein
MLSQIVIEAEAPGNLQTMLRLSIDTRLIAENLTVAQAQLLIGEILDRFAVAEVGKDAGEHWATELGLTRASRGARSLLRGGSCPRRSSPSRPQ